MIRFNRHTRTLIIRLPRWRDRRWLWLIGGFIVLDVLAAYVDRPLTEAMAQLSPDTTILLRGLTQAGDSKYYLIPLVLFLPFVLAARQALDDGSARRVLTWLAQAAAFVFTAIAASGLLVNLLKGLIGRTRPKLWLQNGEYGFAPLTFADYDYNSMPSGHSTTIFALAMALGFFMPRLRLWFFGFAVAVALSRVALTSHYLTDILAGACLGVLFVLWLRHAFAARGWVFIRQRGQYRVTAPGYWLSNRIRAFLWEKFGWRDGARGRLP